ncbi:MAG: FGLLP motif-containing membrane protein [Acidimicrobiales bacterium]
MRARSWRLSTLLVATTILVSAVGTASAATSPNSGSLSTSLAVYARALGPNISISPVVRIQSGYIAVITHARAVDSFGNGLGATATVVEYEGNAWTLIANLVYMPGLQRPGAGSGFTPKQLHLTGATDFLVYLEAADASLAAVLSDVGGHWHMVRFPSGLEIVNPIVKGNRIIAVVDACHPSCVQGLRNAIPYLYDPATGTFVLASALTGGPGNPKVSRIASSIPTPHAAFSSLSSVAVNGGIAAAIAMLLTFPSSLFNETFLENYGDISEWWKRLLRKVLPKSLEPKSGPDQPAKQKRKRAPKRDRIIFIAVLLIGALVNSFNDGGFGISLSSLFTFIAVTLALVSGIAVTALVTDIYHARRHGRSPRRLVAFPMGLVIAAFFVIFSRLINFEPGYLYGIVCGVLFTRELAKNEEGHVAALSVLATMAVSVCAWLIWVPIDSVAEKPGAFFGAVIADDFLAALFVSGLVGSFFGMIPIRGLPGYTIKRWSWLAWAVGFLLALFGLMQILLRPGIAGHGHRPLVVSICLFAAFGVASIVFHEHFENKKRRAEGGQHPTVAERFRTILRDARVKTPEEPAPAANPKVPLPGPPTVETVPTVAPTRNAEP